MAYERKTRDIWILEGNYGYGWEYLLEEDTREEAWKQLKCYTENEPNYKHRIRKRRERIYG